MTRFWVLNTIFHQVEPGILGEMIDSRPRSERVQDEPGPSYAREYGSSQRIMGTCQKFEEAPVN